MELTEKELRDVYRRLTARPGHDRSSCFAADQLVALARGELDPGVRSQALAHLIRCSDCSRELQMLGSLDEWSQTASEGPPPRPTGRASSAGREPVGANFGPTPSSFWRRLPVPVVAAGAALLLLLLASAIWSLLLLGETGRLREELEQSSRVQGQATTMATTLDQANAAADALREERDRQQQTIRALRSRVAELSSPFPNLPIMALDLRRAERRGDVLVRQPVEVPAEARWFTLVVTLRRPADSPAITVEVLDTGAEVVWEGRDLRQAGRGTFTLTFPTQLLSRGIFHLRFLGLEGEEPQVIEEVSIEITRS